MIGAGSNTMIMRGRRNPTNPTQPYTPRGRRDGKIRTYVAGRAAGAPVQKPYIPYTTLHRGEGRGAEKSVGGRREAVGREEREEESPQEAGKRAAAKRG